MRKLATVRRILALDPIAGADRIEVAQVDGWQVIVKKGEFAVGDKCVYFEIDSLLPDKTWCEFMSSRKFRVRTIKMRGQISQGLALSLDSVGVPLTTADDTDLTDRLGVKLYEPKKRATGSAPGNYESRKGSKIAWYKTFPVISQLYRLWDPYDARKYPPFIRKTDETRVQNIRNLGRLLQDRQLVWTEKIDGQSATYFFNRAARRGWKYGLFGVCSRNQWHHHRVKNNWWNMADQLRIPRILEGYCLKIGRSLCVQGEIISSSVQGNKYKLPPGCALFYVFSIYDIDKQVYLSHDEYRFMAGEMGLTCVPEVFDYYCETPADFIGHAGGHSTVTPTVLREGIVVRDRNDQAFSFKAISNEFLLKHGEW